VVSIPGDQQSAVGAADQGFLYLPPLCGWNGFGDLFHRLTPVAKEMPPLRGSIWLPLRGISYSFTWVRGAAIEMTQLDPIRIKLRYLEKLKASGGILK
jgi:hypothetical protein